MRLCSSSCPTFPLRLTCFALRLLQRRPRPLGGHAATGHPASWRMSALVGMSVLPVRDSGVPPVPDRGGHLLRGVFLGNVAAARDDDRAVSREHPLVTVQKARLVGRIVFGKQEQYGQIAKRPQSFLDIVQVVATACDALEHVMLMVASSALGERPAVGRA